MKIGNYTVSVWFVGVLTGLGIMNAEKYGSLAFSFLSVSAGGFLVLLLEFLYITSQGE